jgi:membrane-associated protein
LFSRPDSRLFKRAWVERSEEVFNRYGPAKAIFLARFIPGVRTIMNPLAGILEVDTRTFVTWQVVGGLVWSVGVTVAAYAIGHSIHNLDHYLIPIVLVIVVLSLIPLLLELRRSRNRGAHAAPVASSASRD